MLKIITLEQAKRQLPSFTISRLGVDMEWDKDSVAMTYKKSRIYPMDILSKQLILENEEGKTLFLCLWDTTLPLPKVKYPHDCYLIVCDVANTNLMTLLKGSKLKLMQGARNAYLFYSDVDVQCLMSEQDYKQFLLNGTIEKKRNLNGKCVINPETLEFDFTKRERMPRNATYLNLFDLYGSFNSGLDNALDSVQMNPKHKYLVTKEEKEDMRKVAMTDPNRFFEYAMGDVECLFELWERRVAQLNTIVKDTLDIGMGWDIENCPRSSGKLTETVFRGWLGKLYPEVLMASELLADVAGKRDLATRRSLEVHGRLSFSKTTVSLGRKSIAVQNLGSLWDSKLSLSGLSHGSITAFGKKPLRFNQNLGALVNGGRCVNENPTRLVLKQVFDIDMSGCYGASLAAFSYPIGIPTNITGKTSENDPCKSLEGMLETLYEFEDNLWVAYVHTESELSFSQDLIFSNPDIDSNKIHQKIVKHQFDDEGVESAESELDKTHIDGGFCMVTREILNGILTTESLDICRKVMSDKEWNEFKSKVKVDVITGYLKSDRVSAEEYVEVLSNPKTRGQFDIISGDSEVDNRTRKWFGVELKGFIQPFAAQRKAYKKQSQSKGDVYDLLQNGCKLFINTLYGVMASPYFHTSNTILANNITDRARCGVWMVNKALGTNMSITDGGAYQFNDCRAIVGKKRPGMDAMADYHKLSKHGSIDIKPIISNFDNFYNLSQTLKNAPYSLVSAVWADLSSNGVDVSYSAFSEGLSVKYLHECLDKIASDRISEFWGLYGIAFKFGLEHKETHTSKSMVHFNKSDYLFIDPIAPDKSRSDKVAGGHPYVVKVRGARETEHMKKQFLGFLGGFVDFCDKYQVISEFIKPSELREILQREGLETVIQPGMRQDVVNTLKVNFNQLPFETFKHRKYHLGQIEKTVRGLSDSQTEFIQRWAYSGDMDVLKDMPQHPVFDNVPNRLSFHDYLLKVYLPKGHDLAIQTKRGRANKTGVTPLLVVAEYEQLVNSGMAKGKVLTKLAKKYEIGVRTIERWVSKTATTPSV
jgi:hypothetical protein